MNRSKGSGRKPALEVAVVAVMCVSAATAGIVLASSNKAALRFKAIGSCVSNYNGGDLLSISSGFTPDKNYKTEAWYPNGKQIRGIRNPGSVDQLGHTSAWTWVCADGQNGEPLPAGIYRLKITDAATHRSVSAKLRVLPVRCESPRAKHCDFTQP